MVKLYYSDQAISRNERLRIDTKRNRVSKSCQKGNCLKNKRLEVVTKESLNHSYRIENRERELRRLGRTEEPEREYHENLATLRDAWRYVKDLDFSILDIEQLCKINSFLEPFSTGIRNEMARVSGSNVARPCGYRKLQRMLEESFEIANNLETLDKALFLSLRLLYLHPFNDGNGRTVRLFSNAILYNDSYSPILIPEGERGFYFNILENAIYSQVSRENGSSNVIDGITNEEKTFYNYLTSKINSGMDDLIDYIDSNKKFKLYVEFNRKGTKAKYKALAQNIRNLIGSRGLNANVSYRNSKGGSEPQYLLIKGDIPSQSLQTILDSTNYIKNYSMKEED